MKKVAVVDKTEMEITHMDAHTDADVNFATFHLSTLYPHEKIVITEYVTDKQRMEQLLAKK